MIWSAPAPSTRGGKAPCTKHTLRAIREDHGLGAGKGSSKPRHGRASAELQHAPSLDEPPPLFTGQKLRQVRRGRPDIRPLPVAPALAPFLVEPERLPHIQDQVPTQVDRDVDESRGKLPRGSWRVCACPCGPRQRPRGGGGGGEEACRKVCTRQRLRRWHRRRVPPRTRLQRQAPASSRRHASRAKCVDRGTRQQRCDRSPRHSRLDVRVDSRAHMGS